MDALSSLNLPAGVARQSAAGKLLEVYAREHGVTVRLWADGAEAPALAFPPEAGSAPTSPGGDAAPVPGGNLRVEVGGEPRGHAGAARFLAFAVAQLLQHDNEVNSLSREIA